MREALPARFAVPCACGLFLLGLSVAGPVRAGATPGSTRGPGIHPNMASFTPGPQASGSDGTWWTVPMNQVPPPVDVGTRIEHTIVFDSVRSRFILFGGQKGVNGDPMNDVWVWPVGSPGPWTALTVTGPAPQPRYFHSAVYDPLGDRMLVFGGLGAGAYNDVWSLSLSGTPHWDSLAAQGTAPSQRFSQAAVIDAARNRMLVFGGWDGQTLNDTWSLDLSASPPTWQPVTVTFGPPGSRYNHVAVFDAAHDQMVIYGGQTVSTPLADVWRLSFSTPTPTWNRMVASSPTIGWENPGVALDPTGNRMIVFGGRNNGGYFNDLWALDLSSFAWTQFPFSGPTPSPRTEVGFAIDPVSRLLILQGGRRGTSAFADTWTLASGATGWANPVPQPPAFPPLTPSLRHSAAGFYDAARNRFLMTGGAYVSTGNVTQILGSLQEFTFGSDSDWVELLPSGSFGYRYAHAATYDPVRDRILVFGGSGGGLLNDLWEIRLSPTPAPHQLFPTGTPPAARTYASMIYDPLRDRLVLFGGNGPNSLNDVWQLTNLSGTPAWSSISPGLPAPTARTGHRAIYDPYGDRMLVFGGLDATGSLNDLWSLSLSGAPQWTLLAPAGTAPGPRYGHSMELDANRQRVIVYGGLDKANLQTWDDAWELRIGGQPLAWNPLSPGGTLPPARYRHLGMYDGVHDFLFVSGGADLQTVRSDKFRLQFAPAGVTATTISLLSSDVRPDGVTLKWALSGDAATYARLERRDAAGDWRTIESGPVSGSFATFVDRDVVAGGRYAYRLTAIAGTSMSTSSEVWIDVPVGPAFSLAGFSPNPATREARVGFSLAERTPATIEVLDLGGRRVAMRHIESPAPGAQSIAIAPAGGLSPGLYFVRLVQGRRTLVTRGTVMR